MLIMRSLDVLACICTPYFIRYWVMHAHNLSNNSPFWLSIQFILAFNWNFSFFQIIRGIYNLVLEQLFCISASKGTWSEKVWIQNHKQDLNERLRLPLAALQVMWLITVWSVHSFESYCISCKDGDFTYKCNWTVQHYVYINTLDI